ncbi:kinase-like domain-containing protein [Chlamydoabsidia padenii]|nr:kinase-like domain-containing protein [Chlamydoabsidia padenii]
MTEPQVRRIFHQVAAAVQHLHRLLIVHRDIKDENILLDEQGTVQLIDFGSAAYYREGRLFDTFSGTLDYVAPEILNGESYAGPPQDIWSLGILLYTLIYRETPFYSVDDILECHLRLPYIPYQEQTAVGPADLLYKLLDRDISKRPTIDQVMQDPWLQYED